MVVPNVDPLCGRLVKGAFTNTVVVVFSIAVTKRISPENVTALSGNQVRGLPKSRTACRP